jgi:NTE family protein
MMEAHDARYIEDADFVRTIPIPTLGVQTTEFDLSKKKADDLYEAGRKAAEEFFQHWDFNKYKTQYRQTKPLKRRQKV